MKKALLMAVALILTAGFIACQDEFAAIRNPGESKILESSGAGSSPYFPYEEGKKWNYETIGTFTFDYPEDTPIEDTSWADTSTSVTEVIQETELTGSNPLSVWETKTTPDSGEVEYSYAHIEPDSAYFYEKINDSEPGFVFPSEPKKGDEWDITIGIDDTTTYTVHYSVIDDDAEANGFSNCLMIEVTPDYIEDYDEYENFQYWAKGEGTVMTTLHALMRFVNDNDTITVTYEGETKLIKGPGIAE